jgi:DNA-directed RNA polymerase subunit beta'
MLRRVTISDSGDTKFILGEQVSESSFKKVNKEAVQNGLRPAAGRPDLMGITKASLATDSWLSAASFQETNRVLTEASISSAKDNLMGLKENVIIGKLIPAGTGLDRYRYSEAVPTNDVREALYPSIGYDDISVTTMSLNEDSFDVHDIESISLDDIESLGSLFSDKGDTMDTIEGLEPAVDLDDNVGDLVDIDSISADSSGGLDGGGISDEVAPDETV